LGCKAIANVLFMEIQNASSEANQPESTDTVLEPGTLQAEVAAGDTTTATVPLSTGTEPKPSYVKLAMRNMVRKRGLSLQHFALTTIGLMAFFVGLAYLTR
jgi:hypothetical protein